jgi:hypothetical protein
MGETDEPPPNISGFRDPRKIKAIENAVQLPPGGMTVFSKLTNSFPTKAKKEGLLFKSSTSRRYLYNGNNGM